MTILDPDQTWNLWQQGKNAWNEAIQSGRITEVTFVGDLPSDQYQFQDCHFPAKTNFHHVRFISAGNKPSISFKNADFQEVQFSSVSCTGVSISFDNATFNSLVYFSHTIWQDISFKNAKFKNGPLIFSYTNFEGKSNFYRTNFEINMYFDSVEFKGYADFNRAIFSKDIDLKSTEFKGFTDFSQVLFSETINFSGAKFSNDALFMYTKFGSKNFFLYTKFNGNAYFSDILASKAEQFSFKGASFGNIFVISSEKEIGCVMDFVDSYAKYSLNLGDISCTFHREHKDLPNHKWLSKILKLLPAGFQTPKDLDDISRLRKLKKVAQEEKDHLRALDYKVQEMQAKRWHDKPTEKKSFLLKLLKATPEFIFWLFSNYGRSIERPIGWLLVLTFSMSIAYYCLAPTNTATDCFQKQESCLLSEQVDYWDALGYSASQLFPWVPIARKEELLETRNNSSVTVNSTCIKVLSFIQTLCATLLLFLFGLGARNRFLL